MEPTSLSNVIIRNLEVKKPDHRPKLKTLGVGPMSNVRWDLSFFQTQRTRHTYALKTPSVARWPTQLSHLSSDPTTTNTEASSDSNRTNPHKRRSRTCRI
ncbi:hypothetical protein ACOSQ4_030033 [Xanthoceras sorbifolium]